MAKISVSELAESVFTFAEWLREVRYIASDDQRGSIRNAMVARKEAAADLRYEGFSDKEIETVFRRVEKHFGLI